MNRIINTLLIPALSMLMLSCSMEEAFEKPVMNEDITIEISSGLTKAGYKEDNQTESFVNHIDVFFFEDNAGSPDQMKYHGRYEIRNSPRLTIDKPRSFFGEDVVYHIYLVANSNIDEATFAAVEYYDEFVGMKQEDRNLHLTGLTVESAPKYFLMDAKAKEAVSGKTEVVLNGDDAAENLVLTATLRRAAAKVVINITAENEITFATFNESVDGKPVSDGGLYYIRNLPYQAFLLAEARADETIDATVVGVRTTGKSEDGHLYWNPAASPKQATLTTYVYPNSWSSDIINRETCVVMNMPMIYTPAGGEPVVYHNSWYKIHMTGEKVFRRNGYYEVNIVVKRPGAITETVPEEIEDVHFNVKEWESHTIDVGGDDKPRYLSVNETAMEMHNIATDATTLEFASSSPVTITVKNVYYYNKFGQKTSVGSNITSNIKGVAEGGMAGSITVNSPVPVNNAIRYFTLVVTNQDGLTREVAVTQYPLEYITNQQGWYSYRSDFYSGDNAPTTYENKGSRRVAADWEWNSWKYSTSVQNNYFFGSKVSSMYENGTSRLYYYSWSQFGSTASLSEGNLGALNNARMYHVQITASSGKYAVGIPKLDSDGFTDHGADNAKLVSPSFMIASQLGATQPPGSVKEAERHCREYVEVHDPDNNPRTNNAIHYDNWRLPTVAEIQIIIDFQYVPDAAMDEVLSGPYYWSATGSVHNTGTSDSGTQSAVRCIRDVY